MPQYNPVISVCDTTWPPGERTAGSAGGGYQARPGAERPEEEKATNPRCSPTYHPTGALNDWGGALRHTSSPYEQLLIWAASCLGYFAFMRSGELTVPGGVTFDPAIHLTPTDITVDNIRAPTMLKIHLKASKTDVTRQGIDLYVGQTKNSLCPVVAMLRYLVAQGMDEGPLFRLEDGTPLTRPRLVAKLKVVLQQAGWIRRTIRVTYSG